MEFKSEKDVERAFTEIVKSSQEKAKEDMYQKKLAFEGLMQELNKPNPDFDGYEAFAALLNLPEEEFAVLAPVAIASLEKEYASPDSKLALVQALNVNNIEVEDLAHEQEAICEELDNNLTGLLSVQKRDFLKEVVNLSYNAVADTEGISKRIVSIPIEFCHPDAKMPAYAHVTDAGMDVYALEDITIAPGETKLIPIGIKVALPEGYELQVRAKSGRCLRTKLRVANAPGTIDAGYRDEIAVIIDNIEPFIKSADMREDGSLTNVLFGSSYTIGKGEKFAQLILSEVPHATFIKVDSVSGMGEDRNGGFGSTGIK